VVVTLSFLVFGVLDNAIYRSGLYAQVSSATSVAGMFAAVARWRIPTEPSGKREVLILGHSKIEAALSEKLFERGNPDSHLKLVFGSSAGTTEKMWFYLLKHIDPEQRRYAAIVIPIDSYRTPPLDIDAENQIDVAQCLAPMLDAHEWWDLIGTYTNPDVRAKVILGALVSSHLYALDLQDLLRHPVERYDALAFAKATRHTFLYDWDGFDGDLETLEIDVATAKITHAPPQLDSFRRAEAEFRFRPLPSQLVGTWTQRYHAFRLEWFTRIVSLYARSSTKLVFVQVPRWPFLMPGTTPIDGAPDLRDFITPSTSVTVLDAAEFEDLETPHYFYDVLHVNKLAREVFTARMAKDLRSLLGDLP